MYDVTDGESYDPAEDDEPLTFWKYMMTRTPPPMDPDNNAPVEEDVDPYPGVTDIIGYGDGNYAEAIPTEVYYDAKDANHILPGDAPSTGVHIPHITGA